MSNNILPLAKIRGKMRRRRSSLIKRVWWYTRYWFTATVRLDHEVVRLKEENSRLMEEFAEYMVLSDQMLKDAYLKEFDLKDEIKRLRNRCYCRYPKIPL